MWTEYAAYKMIGTPLEKPARFLRDFGGLARRIRHPELIDIYKESSRIAQIMRRLIRDPMNCIDIGCHLGSVLQCIIELSPNGKHFAFEPTSYKAGWLRRKFPQVDVREIALSHSSGKAQFYHHRGRSGFSGLQLKATSGKPVATYEVQREPLDAVISPDTKIDFIKADIEGGELHMLRGAGDLLKRCRPPIVFECTNAGLAAYQAKHDEIFDLLITDHGYDLYLMKEWLDGSNPLDVARFNDAMQYPFAAFNFFAWPRQRPR